MIKGINLGSGKDWSLKNWYGIDRINDEYLDAKSILPFDDNSIEDIYSSHFFEHVDNKTARNLFAESCRVLRQGGILRIVVPNFGLFLQKYREHDENWFRKIRNGRPEWSRYGVSNCLSNLLLHWIANCDFNGPNGLYRGPPMGILEDDVERKAMTCNTQKFCEWAQSLVLVNDPRVTAQHVNWWDFAKFALFLEQAGFNHIHQRKYMKSSSQAMLKTNMFDSWKPHRKHFSLYVEAIK